ncbi:MAG: alpha/beta fold hydrolase [Candidatus Heimdallarchaeaceae archaeon]
MKHEKSVPFFTVAAGFSNYTREYPAYVEKFGKENVEWACYADKYTIEEHIEEIKTHFPNGRPFILIGHSLGGSLIIEMLAKEKMPSECEGVVLVGASRRLYPHPALNFAFRLPVPLVYAFSAFLMLIFPIFLVAYKFNLHKAFHASFEGFWRLVENGAKRMKKEFNYCLRDIGKNVSDILEENKHIPVLFIRLKKDIMIREEDVEETKSFFHKHKERIIPIDTIHLNHEFDSVVADIINEELPFFGFESFQKGN